MRARKMKETKFSLKCANVLIKMCHAKVKNERNNTVRNFAVR